MSDKTSSQKHHHHHKHREDDATRFKRRSLQSIRLRKLIAKCVFYTLLGVAVILAALVVFLPSN